jgi:hypothetical protein
VIRNAVLHLHNEQPLMADLYALPSPTDVTVVCTNLRSSDGKKPVFIDHAQSTFVFPYLHVRFLEIPPNAVAAEHDEHPGDSALVIAGWEPPPAEPTNGVDPDDELDEDFLKRVRDA